MAVGDAEEEHTDKLGEDADGGHLLPTGQQHDGAALQARERCAQ